MSDKPRTLKDLIGDPMKPREFWITESRCTGKQKAHKTQLECWGEIQHNDNEYHVIEYAAYEKLKTENERLNQDLSKSRSFREDTEAKLAEVEAERDECIKVHDENINLMREFQKLMNQCANELEREREVAKVKREALREIRAYDEYHKSSFIAKDAINHADKLHGI